MDAEAAAKSALAAILANGRLLPLTRRTSTLDEVTGEETAVVTQSGTLAGVVLPRYKGIIFAQMDEALKKAIITGRAKSVLCAAANAAFPPQPLDVLTFDGADWSVVGVTSLSPTGTPIIYTVGVIQL